MRLNENSLYSTPQERADLLKNKKLVMDALCFSLLGFLGCFKLGDNRAALKTYDQTEGKLMLSAIGDSNHDVSLSVKLADEAGVIPNSAAQNVTKLLYKIKSKQVKGKDLDDQQVRDLIKTLKISSNPGDSMVNAAVMEFESGQLNLGQLASKLYNLSKLPKFKQVSGEFRTLVSKGQFTELFAKAGAVTPPTAKISNSSSVKVAAPVAAAPAVDQSKLYNDLMDQTTTPGSMGQLPSVLEKAGITKATIEAFYIGLADWLFKKTFVEKDYAFYKNDEKLIMMSNLFGTNKQYMKADVADKIARSCICGYWMAIQDRIMAADVSDFLLGPIVNFHYYLVPATSNMKIDVFTKDFFVHVSTDAYFLKATSKLDQSWSRFYENLIDSAYMVAGGVTTYISDFNIPDAWLPDLQSTAAQFFMAESSAFYGGKDDKKINMVFKPIQVVGDAFRWINKAFGVTGTALNKDGAQRWLVPVNLKDIKDPDARKIGEKFLSGGMQYAINFIDLSKWEETLKDKVKVILKNRPQAAWDDITNLFGTVPGMPKGYPSTEPFLNWFCDEINERAVTLFSYPPTSWMGSFFYLNAGVHFLDMKGVSPGIWLALYTNAMMSNTINADKMMDDLEAIYAENYEKIEKSLGALFSVTNKLDYSKGSRVAGFLLRMHKEGKFKSPNDAEFWKRIAKWDSADLGDWSIPADQLQDIWDLYQDVDQKAIRTTLITKYQDMRDLYFDQMIVVMDDMPPKEGIETFFHSGWSDVLSKEETPKYIVEWLEKHVDDVDVHEFLPMGPNPIGEWVKEMFRSAMQNKLNDTSKLNLNALLNCVRLGPSHINETIGKATVAEVIQGEANGDRDDLERIWSVIQRDEVEITDDSFKKLIVGLGMTYQKDSNGLGSVFQIVCDLLNQMMAHRDQLVDAIFDGMSYAPMLKTRIINWFSQAGLLNNALKAVKGDAIAPLVEVDHSRLGTLMKYNNIKIPDASGIDYKKAGFKLSDFLKTHGSFQLEPLAVTNDIEDVASCMRRTAEFDVFNKYRHGSIGIKFLKSFNVNLPLQEKANKIWDDAHPHDEVMDPVFHGTGSVAASFILRYGFAVVSSNDPSVVGRMLGDGIYFSNVLDKCGQYVSDGGYSRGIGNKGYLFQMRANLGRRGQDYQAGGGNLVSPEWCVFHPNDQLKIYKAHFIELVDKSEISIIKKKVMNMNESTAIRIYEMTEHLNEDIMSKGCISYTFVDGTIPIAPGRAVDFEHWDPSVFNGKVTMEYSGLGPVVYIEVDDASVAEMYAVRYTSEFMNQTDDFQKYLQLIGGGASS